LKTAVMQLTTFTKYFSSASRQSLLVTDILLSDASQVLITDFCPTLSWAVWLSWLELSPFFSLKVLELLYQRLWKRCRKWKGKWNLTKWQEE
jgi:hypothetical protein